MKHHSTLRGIKARTTLAIVTATFVEPEHKVVRTWTLAATFYDALNAFKGTGQALVTLLVYLLVYAPLWLPLIAFSLWWRRRQTAPAHMIR